MNPSSSRSGVSAERRHLGPAKPAALCRDAATANAATRRAFLTRSLQAIAAFGLARAATADLLAAKSKPAGHPVRLGGPLFARADDPEEWVLAHRKLGYGAAYCPGVALTDTDRIAAFKAAAAKHNLVIAEVGRWVNLLDADPAKRAANLKLVTEGLALAEAIDARCCVDIAGSMSPKEWYGPHPDNLSPKFFDAAVENARKIIDAVKPKRAKFCFEMMGWAIPDTADSYLKLIKAVDRKGFGVHLDPCNAVNSPEKFYRNTDLLNECFDKLGKWIVSCHAKDLTWDVEMNVHFREVRPGTGTMDYETYLKRLAAMPSAPPLMLEHLPNAEEYDKAREHILELGKRIGVAFA
jgi:sugar phosphate isomerase/epimerase